MMVLLKNYLMQLVRLDFFDFLNLMCEYRAIFSYVFSNRNFGRILLNRFYIEMAFYHCACACEMSNYKLDEMLCDKSDICTPSHHCV